MTQPLTSFDGEAVVPALDAHPDQSQEIVRLTLMVIYVIVGIELFGAFILFTQWVQLMRWRPALYYAIFHSVSVSCNAGFDLFQSLEAPLVIASTNNPVVLGVLSLLITVSTLGVTTVYDLVS